MRILFLIILIFNTYDLIFPQGITKERATEFINLLCRDTSDLSSYIDTEELILSQRLGIEYEGVKNKFLIGNELPEKIRQAILNNEEKNFDIINTQENYSEMIIKIPGHNFEKTYYFKADKVISSVLYHSGNWETINSKYIRFIIQDGNLTNKYSIDRLNNFVEELCSMLGISNEEMKLLERKKIYYFLCRDPNDIEILTGYKSLGMCNLAYDYIISTYNSHFHEIAHLLINFRLKKLFPYSHPFLQEGFAVSSGGRGGLSRNVMLRTGLYLTNNFVSYEEYLGLDNFIKEDASFSYPVSGLYNAFLISRMGIDKYLELYKEYSYSLDNPNRIINADYLPDKSEFSNFKDSIIKTVLIIPLYKQDEEAEYFNRIMGSDKKYYASYKSDYYIYKVPSSFVMNSGGECYNYESKKFNEKIPDKKYDGSKYLITIDSSEISVYNLFINTLIANYSINFETNNKKIMKSDGYYYIKINKSIFDDSDRDFEITVF